MTLLTPLNVILLLTSLLIVTTETTTNHFHSSKKVIQLLLQGQTAIYKICMVFVFTLVIKVPHFNNTLEETLAGKGRGRYTRYRFDGWKRSPSYSYSQYYKIRDSEKKLQSVTTSDIEKDITLNDTISNESEFECKYQLFDMMKDLHESIMIDVKDLLYENLKESTNKITHSVKLRIDEASTPLISKTIQTTLTHNSKILPIIQDTLDLTPEVENSNNLLDDMDIEKTSNKRWVPINLTEIEHSNEILQDIELESNFDFATNIRASKRKPRLTKIIQKGHKQT